MNSVFSSPFTFDRVVRILISIGIAVLLFVFLKYLSPILLPFAVAWLLAYILQPVVSKIRKVVRYKSLAIVLLIVFITSLIFCLFFFLVPMFFSELFRLKDVIVNNNEFVMPSVVSRYIDASQTFFNEFDLEGLLSQHKFSDVTKTIVTFLLNVASSSMFLLKIISGAIFVLIYLFFILRDQRSLNVGIIKLLPQKQKGLVLGLWRDLEAGMNLYFRKQAVVALVDACLFSVGFCIIGMPMGFFMGLLLGLLNMVPYLQYLGLPPAALLMAVRAVDDGSPLSSALLSLAVVFIVVQIVQDIFLIPKLMGDSMGLHPAVVLLSISAWGYMLGVLGMIVALPLTSIIKSYYMRYIIGGNTIGNEFAEEDSVCESDDEPVK